MVAQRLDGKYSAIAIIIRLLRGPILSLPLEMLPNYDDFLIKRFEQPDEVRTFEKGKFETVKIGSMTIGRASYEPGWKMVGARGCSDRRGVMRSGTCRHGCVRLRSVPDERRTLLRNAGGRFVLHRPGSRQLGSGR